jgi:hypothetical protein
MIGGTGVTLPQRNQGTSFFEAVVLYSFSFMYESHSIILLVLQPLQSFNFSSGFAALFIE